MPPSSLSRAWCRYGYSAIGLAGIHLLNQAKVKMDHMDVNDFLCNGDGCRAWCSGSDCRVTARCAMVDVQRGATPRFPNFQHLVLDLRARDYTGGSAWPARIGHYATLYGSPVYNTTETAVFFDGVSQWAGVPLNTDGDDMPRATYSIWMKLPKAIPAASNGWVMSQYPDHGWSRAVTLNDARLSATAGVSITVGGAWKSTLGKPPVNQWFHVVGTWEQGGTSCVYLNGKKGLCHAQTSNGHDGVASHETLIIGGRGPTDPAHNPSVWVNDVRVYNASLPEADVASLYRAGRDMPGVQAIQGPAVLSPKNAWGRAKPPLRPLFLCGFLVWLCYSTMGGKSRSRACVHDARVTPPIVGFT